MRRHWRNKAASAAAAILIAASMFSGSLTTAWAEGEVTQTTSEEMPTYEASNDSSTGDTAPHGEEGGGGSKEEAAPAAEKEDRDSSDRGSSKTEDNYSAEGKTSDDEDIVEEAADAATTKEEAAVAGTTEDAVAEGADEDTTSEEEAAEGETSEIASTEEEAAEGETVLEAEEALEDELVDEEEAAADDAGGSGRTPDITAGTSYSSDTTISGKTIQGIVNVEDDTTVIFENCTFIGSEADGTGEMGVSVSGDGVAVLKNATFIVMEEEIDDDGISTVGDEHTLSFSNVFSGGKVGENGSTTVTYPCEADGLTVDGIDFDEILSVSAGDLSIDQDYDTELTYTISYTPDDSGYNVTHSTTMKFEWNTIEFPTVLNVEAGGPAEQGDPEGPPTDSGDGITPKRTITVEKKWKNAEKYYDHSKLRVFVKILDSDGKEIGEVELNKDNRWTVTFPAKGSDQILDMDAEYSVEEYKILNGDGEDVTKGYVVVDRQEKNRYSYSRTDEIKVGGTYILGYSLDGNASYQLMSSDGSRIKTTKVPAKTWTDIEPSDTFYWNTLAPSQDGYNNNDSFWNFQHKSTGGYVHGSEDDFSMSSSSTPIKYYARQFRYKYGENANEYSMYSHDAGDNCTKIAMDGAQIYPIVYSKDTLFTLTNQECFYVYHSSDCSTVRYMLRDDLTDKDAGTFDIVSLVKSGYLYGGYYKSYADEGAPYTGASSKWNMNDIYTRSGFKMLPEPGKTYYLKEVPNEYLRIKTQTVYYTSDKKIYQIYFVTVIDDPNYLTVGFDGIGLDGNALKTKDERGADNPATKVYITTTFKGKKYGVTAYAKVPAGLLDLYSLYFTLSENPDLQDGLTMRGTPYFITGDNVKVWQVTRNGTVTNSGTKVVSTDSSLHVEMLENAMENPENLLGVYNNFDPTANQTNSNSSNGSSSSGGSSSGGGSSSSGSGSPSSGSNSSQSNAASAGTTTENAGTEATDISKINQTTGDSSDTGNTNNESGTGTDPDASLNQEKQGGDAQQNADAWSQEDNKMAIWWIYLLGAGVCAGAWFIIWKRRKDDDSETEIS